ncbi:hypothetical protein HZH66_004539 [Vespula vulgaris]|uniref:Uncharacterized protein n=1 Tax=Vespula vulgaris TaxID=7454 RepID=A0A834NAL3_VESVU|nr:hypothetical protein HZH66_004539 [Vespula vulgaris]
MRRDDESQRRLILSTDHKKRSHDGDFRDSSTEKCNRRVEGAKGSENRREIGSPGICLAKAGDNSGATSTKGVPLSARVTFQGWMKGADAELAAPNTIQS